MSVSGSVCVPGPGPCCSPDIRAPGPVVPGVPSAAGSSVPRSAPGAPTPLCPPPRPSRGAWDPHAHLSPRGSQPQPTPRDPGCNLGALGRGLPPCLAQAEPPSPARGPLAPSGPLSRTPLTDPAPRPRSRTPGPGGGAQPAEALTAAAPHAPRSLAAQERSHAAERGTAGGRRPSGPAPGQGGGMHGGGLSLQSSLLSSPMLRPGL